MKDNVVQQKSYDFAVKIVFLYKKLTDQKKEFTLSKQLLRSGTSIGANVEEGIGSQSRKDFFHKFAIAYKEARETRYWLRLLADTGFIEEDDKNNLDNLCVELCRILSKIQLTIKNESHP